MTVFFAAFLFVHGVIHMLGVAKAWRLAELPQLSQNISPMLGWLWLAASVLFCTAAICLVVYPRWWWHIGAVAVLISTIAIVPSWADARFGAIANAVVLVAVIVAFLTHGSTGLKAAYLGEVARMGARLASPTALARRRGSSI